MKDDSIRYLHYMRLLTKKLTIKTVNIWTLLDIFGHDEIKQTPVFTSNCQYLQVFRDGGAEEDRTVTPLL